jgi:hypothetical protein
MGVDVDLATNTASIPQPKVDKIVTYLDAVASTAQSGKDNLKLKFLEEMLGLLNWISSLLVSGGFHLAQIVSARRAASGPQGHATLTGWSWQKNAPGGKM